MKKLVCICTVFLMGVLCTGCVSEPYEETTASTQESSSSIQTFTLKEVEVIPKVTEYDYESACELGEVSQIVVCCQEWVRVFGTP